MALSFSCFCGQKDNVNNEDDLLDEPIVTNQKRRPVPRIEGNSDLARRCQDIIDNGTWPDESKTMEEWIEWCNTNEVLPFVDRSFPPTTQSTKTGHDLEFRHCSEIYDEPQIFNQIGPEDIKQGELGDCWFVSSLASLAERPELIKNLFISSDTNEEGVFQVKLCCFGRWTTFTLDGYFPCHPLNSLDKPRGQPIYSSTKDATEQELWVMLLEKVYAKRFGWYQLIESGSANDAFADLTGCPVLDINLKDGKTDPEKIWAILLECHHEDQLVTGSIGSDLATQAAIIGMSEEQTGLVKDHCYSILDAKEIESSSLKLLQIRNPHGHGEWQGDFSDKSNKWTDELKEKCNWVDEDDGLFWMTFNDFLILFINVNVCYCPREPFKTISLEFQLQKEKDSTYNTFSVVVEDGQKIEWVGLHQPDKRKDGVEGYCDIHTLIIKDGDPFIPVDVVSCETRNRFAQLQLGAGSYEFICFSSGRNFIGQDKFHEATLTLHYTSNSDVTDNSTLSQTSQSQFNYYMQEFAREKGVREELTLVLTLPDVGKITPKLITYAIKFEDDKPYRGIFVWVTCLVFEKMKALTQWQFQFKGKFDLETINMSSFEQFKDIRMIEQKNKQVYQFADKDLVEGLEELLMIACKTPGTNQQSFTYGSRVGCSCQST